MSVLEEMMFVIVHCVLMEGSGGCGVRGIGGNVGRGLGTS